MKRVDAKLKRSGLVLAFLFYTFVFAGQALAEGYLGDFCWKISDSGSGSQEYSIGKFAVTDVGGGHFTLNGKSTNYENDKPEGDLLEATEVGHGNAEMVGSTIVVTMTLTSYDDGDYGFSVMRWQLENSTLNGTFKVLYTEREPKIITDYDEGSIEFLPSCK